MRPLALALVVALLAAGCGKTEEPIRPVTESGSIGSTSAPASAKPGGGNATGKLRVVKAPADSELASFLRTEKLRAKADGRVLVVYAGAKWCDPCKHFHAMLDAGKLDTRLAKMELVELDVDQDTDRLGAAGYKFRYVPYFALVGADGHPQSQLQEAGKDVSDETLDQLDAWQAQ